MPKLIIANTSCLIVLENIGRLELPRTIFDEISITDEIRDEFGLSLPDWIKIHNIYDVQRKSILELELDAGEASAIALALENKGVCN